LSAKLVPIFGNQNFDTGVAALLLIAGRQKNHVTVQTRVGTFKGDKRREVRRQHSFIVVSSASVNIAILYDCSERVHRPPRSVHADHVHVRDQQQGLGGIRQRGTAQTGHQRTSPRREGQ
jgi:hypothetical protein